MVTSIMRLMKSVPSCGAKTEKCCPNENYSFLTKGGDKIRSPLMADLTAT